MGGIRFNTHYPASLSNTITQNVGASQLGLVPPSRNSLCAASRTAMSAAGTNSDGDADGDINNFWQARNYNLNAANVHAAVFESQGLNDDNVRPNHFSQWWAGVTATTCRASSGSPRRATSTRSTTAGPCGSTPCTADSTTGSRASTTGS